MNGNNFERSRPPTSGERATAENRKKAAHELGEPGAYVRSIKEPKTIYRLARILSNGWIQLENVSQEGARIPRKTSGLKDPRLFEKSDPPSGR
jgi:hypothetical protein